MDATADVRKVLISVDPPLLGELLGKALTRSGLEAVVVESGTVFADGTRFDVAVVSADIPAGAAADVVVRVPATPGRTTRPASIPAPSLFDIVVLVDRLCRHADRAS